MTNEEFSNEFDVLYNSITSNQAPGLDEYEKSVFLTKAQSEILREYFNSRVDGTNGGFDGSQKRQYDFSFLIRTTTLDANLANEGEEGYIPKMDNRGYLFNFPEDYFLSINEVIRDDESTRSTAVVVIRLAAVVVPFGRLAGLVVNARNGDRLIGVLEINATRHTQLVIISWCECQIKVIRTVSIIVDSDLAVIRYYGSRYRAAVRRSFGTTHAVCVERNALSIGR